MSRLLLGAVTIALGVALAPYILPILGWGLVLVVVLAVAGGVLWYGLRVLATAVALAVYPFYRLSAWADGLRSWWAREFMRTMILAGLATVGWSALIGVGWLGDYLACSPGWAHKPRCWDKYTAGSEYGPGGRRWDAAKWYAEGWMSDEDREFGARLQAVSKTLPVSSATDARNGGAERPPSRDPR